MGTKVHSKNYLPGYYSMRDLNENSSSSWLLCYGDKAMTAGQYYNGFTPRTIMDGYPGYGKDALKQKMLEHEAVFRNQVHELHRLYRIQRDMMDEVKRKELHRIRGSREPSSSSSLRASQLPSEDARKWHMAGFPLSNSGYERTSISGVEIVNSPMSCTKGNSTPSGQFPLQNVLSLKDSELVDSRPLKVRKKLFDLELPADVYIDAEDGKKLPDCEVSDVSSYPPNGILKSGPGNRIAASASASCLRNSIRLADLNEPIEVEESTAPSSTDLFSHSSINKETKGVNSPAKSNAGYLGINEEKIHNRDGFLVNSLVERKVDEREQLSRMYEAGKNCNEGSSKSNQNYATHALQQDKLPIPSYHPVQTMLNPCDHPPSIYPSGHGKEDPWRERNHHGLESYYRSRNHSSSRHLDPHLASEAPHSDSFFSSNFSGSWAHSVSSWAKPTSSFSQKVATLDSCLNSAAATGRGLQTSADCRETFGGKWQVNDSSRLNPGLGGKLTTQNGFHHGSASGSKELKVHLPLSGVDYLHCSGGDNIASARATNHGFEHFPKGTCHPDSKPAIDINLNEVVSNSSSSIEAAVLQDLSMIHEKGKPEDRLSALPWIKNKQDHASSSQLFCKAESVTDLNLPFIPKVMLASSESKREIAENWNVKKILGFPIFETDDLKVELSSNVSTSTRFGCSPDGNNVNKERNNRIIDINLECEPEEQTAAEQQTVEKEKQTKGASVRDFIDLNSRVTDCEDTSAPSYESKTANVKMVLESSVLLKKEDANTPSYENTVDAVPLQSSENKNESPQDEVLRNSAETILAISSSCPKIHIETILHSLEASLAESLLWFVDAVSNELKSTCRNESAVREGSPEDFSEEMDDFEAMTLQIQETKEEDYMPVPFVPEVQKVEDIGTNALPTRPRRGQSRRGRQRRDFQRDILPGLASLSRHEVTEDLQTFGGLMRATGHHWISGLTRRNGTRNGGGRGRRRAVVETVTTATPSPVSTPLVQQLNNTQASLEDRSLTGWGKTTRRPRRQRCPAGSPPAVILT